MLPTRKQKKQEGKTSEKREEKKGVKAQKVETPTQSRVTDALIGNEEQNGKQKKKGASPQPRYPGPFGHLL